MPLVKHGEVLPDDPGGAAGRVPPGHPGAPDQLVPGETVAAGQSQLLHHLLLSRRPGLAGRLMVDCVAVVLLQEVLGLAQSTVSTQRLVVGVSVHLNNIDEAGQG